MHIDMSEEKVEEVPAKKQKMEKEEYPMAPDSEWPEAWLMTDEAEDQCKENRRSPNLPVTPDDMKKLGISYWRMPDVDKYEYPIKAIPYDPKDAADPKLAALRDSRGYSVSDLQEQNASFHSGCIFSLVAHASFSSSKQYADIITVHPDHLSDFEGKLDLFISARLAAFSGVTININHAVFLFPIKNNNNCTHVFRQN
jgi:1,2-dihydroxy-3-keto-5-methylthiopentene dioxygenase